MKLNKDILIEIDKVFTICYEPYSVSHTQKDLCEELIYHIFYNDIDYIENGDFANEYLKIAFEKKDKDMLWKALSILRNCGDNNREDIIKRIQLLFFQKWHTSHEEIMTIILYEYLQETSFIPYLKKAAVWDDECIEFFESGFHKNAIRGILKIAKKDSIRILEDLVGKVDEETAPFLERKIKEAKEMYLDS